MTIERPLVSVVTPSFNQARYLGDTIRSVLDQKYTNLEYIIIDGDSTDGSVDIIHKYTDQLAFWVSEGDSGQAEAINKGLSRAKGDILAWLNSDDTYLPGTVASVVDVFKKNPDAALVYGNMLAIDEYGQRLNHLKYHQLNIEDLLCFEIIGQPAVFFRREAFEKAGMLDTSYHCFLDHHLWLRIALQGKILHVEETWAAARYHPEAKNLARPLEFGREAFRLIEEAAHDDNLSLILARVDRRARASVQRVDARYRLDGDRPWRSLVAWFRAFFIHPPTALARINLLASAILQMTGLGSVRELILRQRQKRLTRKS